MSDWFALCHARLSDVEAQRFTIEVDLSQAELARIEEVAPKGVAAGTRYPEAMMKLVNA